MTQHKISPNCFRLRIILGFSAFLFCVSVSTPAIAFFWDPPPHANEHNQTIIWVETVLIEGAIKKSDSQIAKRLLMMLREMGLFASIASVDTGIIGDIKSAIYAAQTVAHTATDIVNRIDSLYPEVASLAKGDLASLTSTASQLAAANSMAQNTVYSVLSALSVAKKVHDNRTASESFLEGLANNVLNVAKGRQQLLQTCVNHGLQQTLELEKFESLAMAHIQLKANRLLDRYGRASRDAAEIQKHEVTMAGVENSIDPSTQHEY